MMQFTPGRYRCRNGVVVEIVDLYYGDHLAADRIKGHRKYQDPRWTTDLGYTGDVAIFENLGKKDPAFDLIEKL